jgi:hypothetical protein
LRNAFVAAEEVESYAVGRTDFWRLKGQILNFRVGQSSPVSELTLPAQLFLAPRAAAGTLAIGFAGKGLVQR